MVFTQAKQAYVLFTTCYSFSFSTVQTFVSTMKVGLLMTTKKLLSLVHNDMAFR